MNIDDTVSEEIGKYLKLETIKEKSSTIKRSQSLDDLDLLRTAFLTEHSANEGNFDPWSLFDNFNAKIFFH